MLEIATAKKRVSSKPLVEIARRSTVRSEHTEQSFVVQRLNLLEARYPELSLLYAIPNGGLRHKATAGKMKAEGVKASVPDLCLPVPRWPFHGLYIEMKAIGKFAGIEQRAFQARLIDQGYAVFECQGDDAAYDVTVAYLGLETFGMKPRTWESHASEKIRALRLLAGLGQGRAIVRWPALWGHYPGDRRS